MVAGYLRNHHYRRERTPHRRRDKTCHPYKRERGRMDAHAAWQDHLKRNADRRAERSTADKRRGEHAAGSAGSHGTRRRDDLEEEEKQKAVQRPVARDRLGKHCGIRSGEQVRDHVVPRPHDVGKNESYRAGRESPNCDLQP